jgi:hypothetical protein
MVLSLWRAVPRERTCFGYSNHMYKIQNLREIEKSLSSINGWFEFLDILAFNLLLDFQSNNQQKGHLLEIGAFEGKSTILLGMHAVQEEVLHVCDIFGGPSDPLNERENLNSYPNLQRKTFEENYFNYLGELPVIHQCSSTSLPSILSNTKLRFIHVDGSHLFENVNSDLQFASRAIALDLGVVAVDDYMQPHALGVAEALWSCINSKMLVPLLTTPSKMYLTRTPLADEKFDSLLGTLKAQKIQFSLDNFHGIRVIRLLQTSHTRSRVNWKNKGAWIPQILRQFLKK